MGNHKFDMLRYIYLNLNILYQNFALTIRFITHTWKCRLAILFPLSPFKILFIILCIILYELIYFIDMSNQFNSNHSIKIFMNHGYKISIFFQQKKNKSKNNNNNNIFSKFYIVVNPCLFNHG